jgi:hypothetical protein
MHRQFWNCRAIEEAQSLLEKMLREKTRPDRRSARKYKIVCFCEWVQS